MHSWSRLSNRKRAAWAIARKEFRAAFASPVAYAWLAVFLGFTGWFFFRGFFVLGLATLRGFFGLLPWTLVFLVPALTMRLWSEERKLGTLEVLLTWPVREREAVAGKFLGGADYYQNLMLWCLPAAIQHTDLARVVVLDDDFRAGVPQPFQPAHVYIGTFIQVGNSTAFDKQADQNLAPALGPAGESIRSVKS